MLHSVQSKRFISQRTDLVQQDLGQTDTRSLRAIGYHNDRFVCVFLVGGSLDPIHTAQGIGVHYRVFDI